MTPPVPDPVRSHHAHDRTYYLFLAVITALGLWIRLDQLGADEVWIDEGFTGFISLTTEWLSYLRIDNNPPLYYLIERAWCHVASCGAFGLRLPSVAAGTLFLVLAGVFTRQLFGRVVSLAVVLLVAVSPIHVYYSQEARVYSFLVLFLLLFLMVQWWVLNVKASTARLALLFMVSCGALYLHYLASVVVVTCLLIYVFERLVRVREVPAGYFVAVGCSLALFVPWVFAGVLGSQATSTETAWITDYFASKPAYLLPVRTVTTFLAGPRLHFNEVNLFLKRYSEIGVPAVMYLVDSLLVSVFFCACAIPLTKIRSWSNELKLAFLEAAGFVVVPLLALIAASILIEPVYVVGRYDLIAYPGFVLLLGCLGDLLWNRSGIRSSMIGIAAIGASFLLFVGESVYTLALDKRAAPYHGVRNEVAALAKNIGNGDGLLVANPNAVLVWYYLDRLGFDRRGDQCVGHGKSFACRLFPLAMELAPASQERLAEVYRDNHPSYDIDYFLDDLSPGSRVILYLSKVDAAGRGVKVDRVGGGIVSNLERYGYANYRAIPENNTIIFTRD